MAIGTISDITVMSRPPLPISADLIAALPPEFRALLQAVIEHYEKRISALEVELAATKKTPRNSLLPPSTEHPHANPTSTKKCSGKKKGGHPGNPRHERALIPVEQCQQAVPCIPETCRRCSTQGAAASHFVEAILTVVETCLKQSRNSFQFLTAATQAHFARQPAHSLLTTP